MDSRLDFIIKYKITSLAENPRRGGTPPRENKLRINVYFNLNLGNQKFISLILSLAPENIKYQISVIEIIT